MGLPCSAIGVSNIFHLCHQDIEIALVEIISVHTPTYVHKRCTLALGQGCLALSFVIYVQKIKVRLFETCGFFSSRKLVVALRRYLSFFALYKVIPDLNINFLYSRGRMQH